MANRKNSNKALVRNTKPANTKGIDPKRSSAVPLGVQYLAECREDTVPHFYFSIGELDEIVEGKNAKKHTETLADGLYLDGMLPAFEWWKDVAIALSFGRTAEGALAEPKFEGQRAKLIAALNYALSSYAAALAESPHYSHSIGTPAGLELIKRYRLFTMQVCACAQEMWPEVDLGWLSEHP